MLKGKIAGTVTWQITRLTKNVKTNIPKMPVK
jgi:hypothetical protein